MGKYHVKILILSFYYQPDLSAGSFRVTSLVEKLRLALPAGSKIDVLTTLPNRYSTFSAEAPELEQYLDLTIHRFKTPSHTGGMIDQSRAFLTFFSKVASYVKDRDYDIVFATSSRLMTAVLGAWVARQKHTILYLDIRDIFVDTIKDVLPPKLALIAKPVFSMLEKWAMKRATMINLVSRGFSDYFQRRYPNSEFSYYTNGIDEEFINEASKMNAIRKPTNRPLKVLYAGNIGQGQGLDEILPALAKRMEGRVNFKILGDGGRKAALIKALSLKEVNNVELHLPVTRSVLIEAYLNADILFLHLNNYDAFKKVLPSKIFEYAALGKPIWAGISGYSAQFVKTEVSNAVVFSPCNVVEAEKVFEELKLEDHLRIEFIEKYDRRIIAKKMANEIIEVAKRHFRH